jgi:SAM-dependent methyltransferase
MRESDKSKRTWKPGSVELRVLLGKGLDIGPADSPILPDVRQFDLADGDANYITKYVSDTFDYVYASHCLEHMHKPKEALLEWWKLVKPGGHIVFAIPDEDLYEQGVFPSRFNPDHKATFTLSKTESWSPLSINVLDMARSLPDGEIVTLALQDHNYDRSLMTFGPRNHSAVMNFLNRTYKYMCRKTGLHSKILEQIFLNFEAIDQTRRDDTLAQIQCIVKKLT